MNQTDKNYSDFNLGDYVVFKKTYTEKELRTELEMKGKSNPWMNRIINYLFEW